MLLTKEADAIEHFPRASRGRVDALVQLLVLRFELSDALFSVHVATTAFSRDALQSRLCGLRAFAKCRELLAQIADERLEFFERFRVRPYGGRH
jgi:hypothetical protein